MFLLKLLTIPMIAHPMMKIHLRNRSLQTWKIEANRIANTFHDAGVLTIGFSEDANTSCYDSVMRVIRARNIRK